MTTTDREFLTTQEAAAILRVHPSTVSRYVGGGELTGTKFGSKLLIERCDLDEFIDRHKKHAEPPAPAAPRAPRPVSADREALRREHPHLARVSRRSA